MDPAAVMTLYTWDGQAESEHFREVDVEISKWGDPKNKNAQFVIQPYFQPSNVFRFDVAPGSTTFSFRWVPGRISFETSRSSTSGPSLSSAAHVFTSGVPSPGGEAVQINLYAFGNTRIPMKNDTEVVVEKFQFLP